MSERKIFAKKSLTELFNKFKAENKKIYAPIKDGDRVIFGEVSSPEQIDKEYIQTTLSPKELVFPRFEELFRYKYDEKNIKMEEPEPKLTPIVLFGIRPCDAKAFSILNAVFSWDYKDKFFIEKLKNLQIIAVSCKKADEFCFCTSVDGNPGGTEGSDILLTEMENDNYLAEILTDNGKKIVASAPSLFTEAGNVDKEKYIVKLKPVFELKQVAEKLPKVFDNANLWAEQSMRCLGCGACAYICPSCVCFDIQDESNKKGGRRYRTWDSCAFSQFTIHTSGHNPRDIQSNRWRQRIMHKFLYFNERLGVIGCIGCGRCSRACPADMNILEHVKMIMEVK